VLFDLKEGRRVAGPAALYASPNDPIDFANQILRLLDSETLRDEHGGVGRRRVEQSLNWDNEKVAYLEAFERALQ
jgi:glycosyltransferase involved in cell wall biosynthesis